MAYQQQDLAAGLWVLAGSLPWMQGKKVQGRQSGRQGRKKAEERKRDR
jgi:hypothetical protein